MLVLTGQSVAILRITGEESTWDFNRSEKGNLHLRAISSSFQARFLSHFGNISAEFFVFKN